jgi:curli production assembly/transport component CsgE
LGKLTLQHTILALYLPFASMGQRDSAFVAWFDVQTVDKKQVISAWCQNNTVSPERLYYKAYLSLNHETDSRENSTLTLPHQPTLLRKAIFAVPSNQFDSVTLRVYLNDRLVAAAFLKGNPTKTPALPPERIGTPTEKEFSILSELEIEGLILDETRSKLAHDFYELFYNSWVPPEKVLESYLIVFRELPTRTGLGARVSVEVNDQELSQLNLHPKNWEELALQLAEALKNYLENPDASFQEIELEDLDGTGIY